MVEYFNRDYSSCRQEINVVGPGSIVPKMIFQVLDCVERIAWKSTFPSVPFHSLTELRQHYKQPVPEDMLLLRVAPPLL